MERKYKVEDIEFLRRVCSYVTRKVFHCSHIFHFVFYVFFMTSSLLKKNPDSGIASNAVNKLNFESVSRVRIFSTILSPAELVQNFVYNNLVFIINCYTFFVHNAPQKCISFRRSNILFSGTN